MSTKETLFDIRETGTIWRSLGSISRVLRGAGVQGLQEELHLTVSECLMRTPGNIRLRRNSKALSGGTGFEQNNPNLFGFCPILLTPLFLS